MRMMNPTAEAQGIMADLNIEFYDMNGNMKGLPDIIDMLNGAFAGMSNERHDRRSTIFLRRHEGHDSADERGAAKALTRLWRRSTNSRLPRVTDARMQGLAGGIEYLKGSVDSFVIGAALPFLDTLGGLARGAGNALTAFGGLPQPSSMPHSPLRVSWRQLARYCSLSAAWRQRLVFSLRRSVWLWWRRRRWQQRGQRTLWASRG